MAKSVAVSIHTLSDALTHCNLAATAEDDLSDVSEADVGKMAKSVVVSIHTLSYVSSHQKTRFIEFFYQICFFPFLQSFDMVKQKYEILDTNSLY